MSDWNSLIFGSYSAEEIAEAVDDDKWQEFRESLKGLSNDEKFDKLKEWMKEHNNSEKAKIQVTNYVNALARGGQISLAECPPGHKWQNGTCVKMSEEELSQDTLDTIDWDNLEDDKKLALLEILAEPVDEERMLPFPNEHACRLKEPGQFDSFRRSSRTSGGKRYDIIWGVKDGRATEQAYRYPKSVWSTEQARTHCRSHKGILFEPAKRSNSIIWENLEEADIANMMVLRVEEVPPMGISGIPEEVMSGIPPRLQWWNQECEELRIAMRNEYVNQSGITANIIESYPDGKHLIKCSKGLYFLATLPEEIKQSMMFNMTVPIDLIEADMPKTDSFVLMQHFWKGKQKVEHYDLFLGDDQFVFIKDISRYNSEGIKRTPYSKDFKTLGRDKPAYLKAGGPGNPSKMASWVKTIDGGEVAILERKPSYMRIRFEGKVLNGIVEFVMNEHKVWTVKHQRELSASASGTSIIRFELQSNEAYFEGEDLIVPGMALSYGVWNGEYYPSDVVTESAHMIKGIPVAVGTHFTEKNVGHVRNYKIQDGGIRIEGVITGEYKLEQQRVLDGEFVGYSVEVNVEYDPMRRIIMKIKSYDRVVAVDIPACSVCTIDGVCN